MAASTPYHFEWDLEDGVAVVEITSREINSPERAQELRDQLRALVRSGASRRLLLDCRNVEIMTSTAFAMLLGFAREVAEAGGELRVCAMEPGVRLGADIIRLGELAPIHDDRASALAAFS